MTTMPSIVTLAAVEITALPPAQPKATSTSNTDQAETALSIWAEGASSAGVWECTVGEFTTARDGVSEVCTIIAGRGALIREDGQITELSPGTLIVIPDGWSGVWRIDEDMRKTYVYVPTR